MRCETAIEQIQEWLDKASTGAMPEEIGAHIRGCAECRTFIQRWNHIEVGIQSLREEAPLLPNTFAEGLKARLAEEKSHPGFSMRLREYVQYRLVGPFGYSRRMKFAVAGLSMILLVAVAVMVLSAAHPFSSLSAQNNMATVQPNHAGHLHDSTSP